MYSLRPLQQETDDQAHPSLHLFLHERLEDVEDGVKGLGSVDVVESLGPHWVSVLDHRKKVSILPFLKSAVFNFFSHHHDYFCT